jgi:hypothetical protein
MAENPTSPSLTAKIDDLVKKFIAEANEAGYPIFIVSTAYVALDGHARYRTMLNGDSPEVIEAIHTLLTMLEPADLSKLLDQVAKENPAVAAFRELHRSQPGSTKVH